MWVLAMLLIAGKMYNQPRAHNIGKFLLPAVHITFFRCSSINGKSSVGIVSSSFLPDFLVMAGMENTDSVVVVHV